MEKQFSEEIHTQSERRRKTFAMLKSLSMGNFRREKKDRWRNKKEREKIKSDFEWIFHRLKNNITKTFQVFHLSVAGAAVCFILNKKKYTLNLRVACIYGVKHLVDFRSTLFRESGGKSRSRSKVLNAQQRLHHIHFENCFVVWRSAVAAAAVSIYERLEKINKSYRLQPNITIKNKVERAKRTRIPLPVFYWKKCDWRMANEKRSSEDQEVVCLFDGIDHRRERERGQTLTNIKNGHYLHSIEPGQWRDIGWKPTISLNKSELYHLATLLLVKYSMDKHPS